MRHTKVVCTLGPSSEDYDTIRSLICEGMDVARLNFSHGTHDVHRRMFEQVRDASRDTGKTVAIMGDLQGPKIRTGPLSGGGPVHLESGASFCITTREVPGDSECVSTTYESLPHDVHPGDRLLLADGLLELRAVEVVPPDVFCTVVHGGELGEHKGVNLPGVDVSSPTLTPKDIEDLEFALELGVDYIALSFVRSARDITLLKERIGSHGHDVPVVAKIERPEAVSRIDEILAVTDAAMVARGDLGVEMNLDEVPQIQKEVIRKCNHRGIPVITATQMLESMMSNPRPTRAEVADIANAIHDGTDAVMLSGETAVGRFPAGSAATMARIAARTDEVLATKPREEPARPYGVPDTEITFAHAIGQAASHTADDVRASCIACFTMSGYSARMISRFRPRIPLIAITLSEATCRRCAMYWGVRSLVGTTTDNLNDMVLQVDETLTREQVSNDGDIVIIVAGTPLMAAGRTNILKIHRIGDTDVSGP